jgi:hypothetical protein
MVKGVCRLNMNRFGIHRVGMLFVSLLISACGSKSLDVTPTIRAEEIQTEAVATFSAGLTQTVLAFPTDTPTATMTPTSTSTSTPAQTDTQVPPTAGSQPTSSCYSLAFVADVTIPDNTTLKPGDKFTKTWRVKNNGTCNWDEGFKFNFVGGEAMGGTSLALTKVITPGAETELSVALTAPSKTGTFRGNWRMTNAAGTYFGDEVYVLIVVSGSASTSTPTATNTPSMTPTVTSTVTEVPTESTSP